MQLLWKYYFLNISDKVRIREQTVQTKTCLVLKKKAPDRSKRRKPLTQQQSVTHHNTRIFSSTAEATLHTYLASYKTKLSRQPPKALSVIRAVKNSTAVCAYFNPYRTNVENRVSS